MCLWGCFVFVCWVAYGAGSVPFQVALEEARPGEGGGGATSGVAVETLDAPLEPKENVVEGGGGLSQPAYRMQRVILDAGHGGSDTGEESPSRFREKDLTLAVAKLLAYELKKVLPVEVFLTRRGDVDMSVAERAEFAKAKSGDFLICLHAGASFSPTAHGFEIFCSPPTPSAEAPDASAPGPEGSPFGGGASVGATRAIAESVAEAVVKGASAENRGIRDVPCRILHLVGMPGFLIEVGNLTNPTEAALLETEAYQTQMAQAIAAGLKTYLAGGEPTGAGE